MKISLHRLLPAFLILSCQLNWLAAQELGDGKNVIGANFLASWNVKSSFEGRQMPGAANIPSFNGIVYDDGFVGVDSTGNALGLTSYWGYQSSEQIAGDRLLLSQSRSGSLGDAGDDAHPGAELTFSRELGRSSRFRWGVETGVSFVDMDFDNRSSGPGTPRISAFDLDGVVPLSAPYAGPQTAGPGVPLLEAFATPVASSVHSELDILYVGNRIGPYANIDLSESVSVGVSAGLHYGYTDNRFSSRSTGIVPGTGMTLFSSEKSSEDEWLLGGYARVDLRYRFSKATSLVAGAQWDRLGDYSVQTKTRSAKVDMHDRLSALIGVNWAF